MSTVLWIVIFALAVSVVMKLRHIFSIRSCPAEASIQDYFEGRLKRQDKVEYERVISHLGICDVCQQRLTDLAHNESEASGKGIEDHLIK